MINFRSPTQRKKEYDRLTKNLKAKARYYANQGYAIKPPLLEPLKNPKKKDIEELKEITKKFRTDYVYTIDTSTGEMLNPNDVQRLKRKARKERKERIVRDRDWDDFDGSQIIVDNYLKSASHFPSKAYPKIKGWIDGLIKIHGIVEVAKMIKKGYDEGYILTHEIAYDETLLFNYMKAEMKAIGFTGVASDSFMDLFDTDFVEYD